MNDKSLGSLIVALGLAGIIIYLYWLLAPANSNDLLFYCPWANARWAIVIPIVAIVLLVLIIAIWIGWTMAATPPPKTLEEFEED
ncbi:MAG: transcriptional regulator [Candidatus Bathyarchaeota archaeon]|nr:MAG: transcriptional regulator [Candidatus Bathyarchaeota archaeon]